VRRKKKKKEKRRATVIDDCEHKMITITNKMISE